MDQESEGFDQELDGREQESDGLDIRNAMDGTTNKTDR